MSHCRRVLLEVRYRGWGCSLLSTPRTDAGAKDIGDSVEHESEQHGDRSTVRGRSRQLDAVPEGVPCYPREIANVMMLY
jgi:hypothetical protein